MGQPDIVVIAKPLAGGLPLGAFMAKESFAEALSPGMHGSTFGGGPLTCAVALEFLATIEEEDLLENVRERGLQLRAGLSRLSAQFDFIREVRGEGLIVGAELAVEGRPYVTTGFRQGLLINCTQERVLRFLPPFIVSEKQVEDFLKRLAVVLGETKRPVAKAASEADSPHALAASR
jgi:acetylornithine/succinyldiaminopimelate/putrescine aminotransferase